VEWAGLRRMDGRHREDGLPSGGVVGIHQRRGELGAGLLLALGLLIPLAAAGLVAQGIVIITRVHWVKGFWSSNGGYEYPLALLGGSVAIALTGPGGWSLDARLPVGLLYEPILRWGALLVAIAVAAVATFLASRQAAAA
jgi:putative oxidoreductase